MKTNIEFEKLFENCCYMDPSYDGVNKQKLIAHGTYNDYEFFVFDYGTHPCCYVALDETHNIVEDAEELINCHGGITHIGKFKDGRIDNFCIGWDYSHIGDYYAMPMSLSFGSVGQTTYAIEELIDDCVDVIDQIVEFDNK